MQGIVNNRRLQINKAEFSIEQKNHPVGEVGKTRYRKYIIAKLPPDSNNYLGESANYPIVVYRFSETEFSALLLRCTHQGTELNVNGAIITCSAHGSEFGNKGEVLQGPADQRLKSLAITTDEKNIYLQLA